MKGFTLIETLVAITVVLLAVMGPFQLVKDSLTASYVARDQLVATALAEEGLEYVRSIRDANYLYNLENPMTPRSWFYRLDGTGGPDCFTGDCMIDPTQSAPNDIISCGPCVVLKQSTGGLYTQLTGVGYTPTRFMRKVRIDNLSTNREARVTITVTFTTRNTPFTVTVTDTLYNWL